MEEIPTRKGYRNACRFITLIKMTEKEAEKVEEPAATATVEKSEGDATQSPLKRKAEEGEDVESKKPKADEEKPAAEEEVKEKSAKAKGKEKMTESQLKGKSNKKYDSAPEDEEEDDEEEEEDDNGDDTKDIEEEDEEEDALEEIDTTNIIQGSRTRGRTIDYQKAAEEMAKEEAAGNKIDDEEDEDGEYTAPPEEN